MDDFVDSNYFIPISVLLDVLVEFKSFHIQTKTERYRMGVVKYT